MAIPFVRELDFKYGEAAPVTPQIRRVVANNPGPFTYFGTGSYIIGHGKVAIVDPGPDDKNHIDALLNAVRNETVSHILITHTHRDHSPGAAMLKAATGAKTYGFGPHPVQEGSPVVEEGGDHAFKPDVVLRDGDTVNGAGWTADAVYTPGHLSNHLCFGIREDKALLTGDHVMGWSTTVISPPDGDMQSYMASLDKLLARDDRLLIPTHGAEIKDPKPFVRAYAEHRRERERQILKCLADGVERIPDMVKRLYVDVDPRLHGAAGRSVLAHLIHLVETGHATVDGLPDTSARFKLKS